MQSPPVQVWLVRPNEINEAQLSHCRCRFVNFLPLTTEQFDCDHNATSDISLIQDSKMGERLPGQKSFVCSFFDCKAKFSKSWKLEAHLCKHTGLVSLSLGWRLETSSPIIRWIYYLSHMVRLPSETVLLWELRPQLLHSLPAHQTWTQPQRGKTTQVCDWKMTVKFSPSMCVLRSFSVLRCLVDDCHEAFVTNGSLKNHMTRVHDKREKQYMVLVPCRLLCRLLDVQFTAAVLWLAPSVTTRAAGRTSARGTSWRPISASIKTFGLFSEWSASDAKGWRRLLPN